MDIIQAAKQLTGVDWNLRGNVLEQAEDNNPRVPAPSMEAIQALMNTVAYRDLRRPEYPSIGDQLDALWKGGQAAADMLAQIEAVKAKYPKP